MQVIDGQPVFSATDLVGFLACEHLTALERAALAGLVKRPMRDDPELDVIRSAASSTSALPRRPEARAAGRRQDRDRRIDEDRGDGSRRGRRNRSTPWPRGDDVVYQATFFDGTWLGYADFLLRVEDPERPRLGPVTTRSPTPSSPDTSRRAPSSRSARTSTSSSGSRASAPSGCTSPSAAAPATVEPLGSTTTWPTTGRKRPVPGDARRDATPPTYPPDAHLPGAGRALRRLPLGGRARSAAARTTTSPWWPASPPGSARRSRPAGSPRSWRSAIWRCPFEPPLDGRRRGARAGPRAGADPGRGRRAGRLATSCSLPGAATRLEPERGLRLAAAADAGRPVLRHRGRPVRLRRRARIPLRRPRAIRHGERFHAFWAHDADGRHHPRRREARLRTAHGLRRRPPRAGPGAPRLPLRAVRADRPEAAHGPPRDPRGGGRPAAPRRRPGRPLRRGAAGAARIRRELLDQAARAAVRLRPRGRPARRGLEHRRLRAWLQLGRASGPSRGTSPGSSATTATTSSRPRLLRDWLEGRRAELADATGQPSRARRPDPEPAGGPDRERCPGPGGRRPATGRSVPADPTTRTGTQQARWLLAQLLAWHRREEKAA